MTVSAPRGPASTPSRCSYPPRLRVQRQRLRPCSRHARAHRRWRHAQGSRSRGAQRLLPRSLLHLLPRGHQAARARAGVSGPFVSRPSQAAAAGSEAVPLRDRLSALIRERRSRLPGFAAATRGPPNGPGRRAWHASCACHAVRNAPATCRQATPVRGASPRRTAVRGRVRPSAHAFRPPAPPGPPVATDTLTGPCPVHPRLAARPALSGAPSRTTPRHDAARGAGRLPATSTRRSSAGGGQGSAVLVAAAARRRRVSPRLAPGRRPHVAESRRGASGSGRGASWPRSLPAAAPAAAHPASSSGRQSARPRNPLPRVVSVGLRTVVGPALVASGGGSHAPRGAVRPAQAGRSRLAAPSLVLGSAVFGSSPLSLSTALPGGAGLNNPGRVAAAYLAQPSTTALALGWPFRRRPQESRALRAARSGAGLKNPEPSGPRDLAQPSTNRAALRPVIVEHGLNKRWLRILAHPSTKAGPSWAADWPVAHPRAPLQRRRGGSDVP